MTTFALITQNNCTFDDLEKYVVPMLYRALDPNDRATLKKSLNDYLWSVVSPHVQFIKTNTDQEEMLTCMCTHLISKFPDKKFDDFYYHTEPSYSFPKKYLEQVYYHLLDSNASSASNINNLGCLFNLKHHAIEHSCAIIANRYDLSSSCFVKIDEVTKEDILRVIRRRYYFSAILIQDQKMVKYYYQNLPHLITQVFGLESTSSISKVSFTLFRYNLVFYFVPGSSGASTDTASTSYINQIATRMCGSHIIHGDVLMIHELDDHVYGNICIREAKRLNVLSYGRLYDRDLKEAETKPMDQYAEEVTSKETTETKKVIPIWSRYLVVERRMLKWQQDKNKCIYCENEESDKLYTCPKCYRVKYCSKKCEEDFRSYHSGECF